MAPAAKHSTAPPTHPVAGAEQRGPALERHSSAETRPSVSDATLGTTACASRLHDTHLSGAAPQFPFLYAAVL